MGLFYRLPHCTIIAAGDMPMQRNKGIIPVLPETAYHGIQQQCYKIQEITRWVRLFRRPLQEAICGDVLSWVVRF